jgi:hypothetical protein
MGAVTTAVGNFDAHAAWGTYGPPYVAVAELAACAPG